VGIGSVPMSVTVSLFYERLLVCIEGDWPDEGSKIKVCLEIEV
jgi:hypothetical protein